MAIVTLKDALKKAEEGQYGIGMFNVINIETINSVLDAAEENASPVIMSYPEVDWRYVDADLVTKNMVEKARSARVPVVLHYDHGHNLDFMQMLLDLGWTSLMIDESKRPLEENIAITSKVVEMAKKYGASVEAELGHVPFDEGGHGSDLQVDIESLYTKVDEAVYFVKRTGVDALAVSIGTVHGEFKSTPKLNLERLQELQASLPIPMVLHGGSGLSDQDFRNCIARGIRKINVFTEIMLTPANVIKARLAKEPGWKMSYTEIMDICLLSMKDAIKRNMDVFMSSGKAW